MRKSVTLSELKYAGVGTMLVSAVVPGTVKFQICSKVCPSMAIKLELYMAVMISGIVSPFISTKIDWVRIPLNLSSYIVTV